jgi:hypothetical protein
MLTSAKIEPAVDTVRDWATSDGLLLVTESLLRLLLKGTLDTTAGEDEGEDSESEDSEDDEEHEDGASAAKTGPIPAEAQRVLQRLLLDPLLIVVDEAHRIQNPRSQLTRVSD